MGKAEQRVALHLGFFWNVLNPTRWLVDEPIDAGAIARPDPWAKDLHRWLRGSPPRV